MTDISYTTIVGKAKEIKSNVEKNYKIGVSTTWAYYIANAILKPNKKVGKVEIKNAAKPTGDYVSNQIYKKDYIDIADRLIKYVQKNKELPNYVTWNKKKLRVRDYTYALSRILVFLETKHIYPNYVNVNTKSWTKPTEFKNIVYKYFVQKTGKKFTTIDDLLGYIAKNYRYEYYFDDKKSNKQVIDSMAGNCTDLLQFLCNMAEEMGYDWKCIHVKCRQSGTGHVFGKFRHKKNTGNDWIVRDIACVASDGSITCVWCSDGYVQAINPSWFLQNLNR